MESLAIISSFDSQGNQTQFIHLLATPIVKSISGCCNLTCECIKQPLCLFIKIMEKIAKITYTTVNIS